MNAKPRLTTAMAKDGAAARLALTVSETEQCCRLLSPSQQSDFRAGRLAAKRAASRFAERHPRHRIEVWSRADGCPRLGLLGRGGVRHAVHAALSISHRDGHAVAVVAPAAARVGIDLERSRSVPLQAIRYFLTPRERELAARTDPALLWSLKEAAWKALGLGRSVPFTALELRTDDEGDGQLVGVAVRDTLVAMHAQVYVPWPGYHAAVVWMAGGVA